MERYSLLGPSFDGQKCTKKEHYLWSEGLQYVGLDCPVGHLPQQHRDPVLHSGVGPHQNGDAMGRDGLQ